MAGGGPHICPPPRPLGGLALSRRRHGARPETPGCPSEARELDRRFLPFASLVRPREFLDRRDDALDFGRADPRVDGELEETRDDVLGDGTSTADLQVPYGLLFVQRHRILCPAAVPVFRQVRADVCP